MKTIWKRMATVFLAAIMAVTLIPFAGAGEAYAVGNIDAGTTGTCKWELYKIGSGPVTLSISAAGIAANRGIMEDYVYSSTISDTTAPWAQYRDQIEKVEFHDVTIVGDYAFYNFNNITGAIEIDGVKRIGYRSFAWCKNIEKIHIEGNHCIIEEDAFAFCEDKVMKTVTLNGIASIGYDSFEEVDCQVLELGEGLDSIDRGAFNCNEALTTVLIPNTCTSVGYSAFGGCTKMVSAYIKNPTCEIGDYAFEKTVTIGVKKNSKALEWAEKNGFMYKFFGDIGAGIFNITEAGVKLSDAHEGDYTIASTLEAIIVDGMISYAENTKDSGYLDLNKDGKWDIAIERQADMSFLIRALKNRSVGGPVSFKLSKAIRETAENNGLSYYSTFTIKLPKITSPMTVSPKTATVKYKKLKKKNQTLAVSKVLTIKKATGTLTFKKLKGNKKITINKSTGKVTVKKKLKKGKYKIKVKVTDAGNDGNNAVSKTVTFTVKVK